MSSETLDRGLILDAVRVTEAAAIASWGLVGRGDEKAADQAAVDAMRNALNDLDISGVIVIGEGERDEAPMLYIGEEVGKGGPRVDIALDPLEGTTLTAKAMANALAVMAWAPAGTLLNAPDTYMDKIACGPGFPEGILDLDRSPADNVKALAEARGTTPDQITVCVLDRPRHADIIDSLRSVGARVYLITDGDVAGVINTADPETGVDLYIGQGGAPTDRRLSMMSAWRGRSSTQ
ncbi:MAG: fructose-bisphosphatase class II family protein, partial [Caulobacteraceae bacterium]|nr:fructose-bisphosphatase class II family protein [Caulobacteraceae bacterium]